MVQAQAVYKAIIRDLDSFQASMPMDMLNLKNEAGECLALSMENTLSNLVSRIIDEYKLEANDDISTHISGILKNMPIDRQDVHPAGNFLLMELINKILTTVLICFYKRDHRI